MNLNQLIKCTLFSSLFCWYFKCMSFSPYTLLDFTNLLNCFIVINHYNLIDVLWTLCLTTVIWVIMKYYFICQKKKKYLNMIILQPCLKRKLQLWMDINGYCSKYMLTSSRFLPRLVISSTCFYAKSIWLKLILNLQKLPSFTMISITSMFLNGKGWMTIYV